MKKGFTLIELLIVIAIIAILAAVLFSNIGQTPIRRSNDAKRLSDMHNLRTALTLYYTEHNGVYPADAASLATELVPDYIPALPRDPRHDRDGCDPSFVADVNRFPSAVDADGDYGYRYLASADQQSYVLQACLQEIKSAALEGDCDDATAAPPCFDNTIPVYDIHS